MRLLRRDSDGKYCLKQFSGKNAKDVPFYAILSHTWGADGQEVTFNDLTDDTSSYTHKEGYRKLEFCQQQAAQDGLSYFWIDTCCIDKSSSTELHRSLNSMFRWYQGAARCYVYLADVSVKGDPEEDEEAWKLAFEKSRWFTRGWTLQELLAPPSVVFYSQEAKRLGDKHSLEQTIHEITQIPIKALQGTPLSYFSVKERRSWAANRQTTEEEDEAYCLQGIFDVCVPLMYGSGRAKTMAKLDWEIAHSEKSGEEQDVVTIGGASWKDLQTLDNRQLKELDSKLVEFSIWFLKEINIHTVDTMSAEAGRKLQALLESMGVSYYDETNRLRGRYQTWRQPWAEYEARNLPDLGRMLGYLGNRWWWANGQSDLVTGIIAARTLVELMIWRGIW
ncbi:HET-domain-containing protein [Dothidotthia symphoricarpi CBS 119687]|uniref:HET-domain-containing protein n=1 Tax=Dothidotthia symphoricarpi CBS 119687 TaxID=1392245 RepID=A0A6A6AAI1_9PLEO|nr:HET-domain-containing protein [Dothidotthia symphoricarpi CBS 119687]KAF2128223.1 HET-domain-containing protein [Dothidotthia symphoricarpi CBS 119687]